MTSLFRTALLAASTLTTVPALAQTVPEPATAPGATSASAGSTDRAAQPESDATDDIVVTAQRRKERVVDVPISITVANEAQLERQQVNTVNDLSRISPSLEIQQAPSQNTGGGGQIRGIGTQTFNNGAVGAVGIVVDQVSQGNANIGDLFDVARIEVLKGPQGTLFGLTTSAGVINITTNAPDPTRFSGKIRTELSGRDILGSGFGNQIVQAAVNIPVSADSALRISGLGNFRQGVNHNTIGDRWDTQQRYSVRGRYLWTPTADLSVNVIGDYSHQSARGTDFFTLIRANAATTAALASCGVTPHPGNQDYCTARRLRSGGNNYGGSLQMEYDAGPFKLTSISAFRRSDTGPNSTSVFRADPLPLQVVGDNGRTDVNLITQEFRVSSPGNQFLEYTLGAFISRQRSRNHPERFSVTLRPAPGIVLPIVNTPGAEVDVTDESMAAFGEFTAHLTDTFRLIAGGRYTGARLALNRFDFGAAPGVNPVTDAHTTYENFSYRLGAQYQFSNDTMAYVTAARGFKGAQIAVPQLPALPYPILPEVPTDYEAGIKSTLFGGWVMDLNAFYTKIKNFQGQLCATNPATGGLSCNQINIDGVKTRGAELNFFGRVFPGLTLNTGLIYAKATYPRNYTGTDNTNIGGTQLANSPKWKFTASGEYETLVTSGLKSFLAVDAVWKSRIRYEPNSFRASTFGQHWLVGGRIGIRNVDDRWSLAAFARNLFNVHEPLLIQTSFPDSGAANAGAIYGAQSYRQIGLQLEGKF